MFAVLLMTHVVICKPTRKSHPVKVDHALLLRQALSVKIKKTMNKKEKVVFEYTPESTKSNNKTGDAYCNDPQAPCKCKKIYAINGPTDFVEYTCDESINKANENVPRGFQCVQLTGRKLVPFLKKRENGVKRFGLKRLIVHTGCELRCVGKACN
ncbi:uncharacterized protein LOC130646300 [Hydractinia symbiolongicarpus]|uniref:uncharacterized protein LOC130646300 n=1 Tax=Hydractinia symbiolongicarpus TaxID=13093 RepID=UPI00254FA7D1|nr:uncharacterized protein LOC130646300 [Hydractinia symbiolongicarpus]